MEAVVRFQCPECHKEVDTTVRVPALPWGSTDKISDMSAEDNEDVTCPECDQVFPVHVYHTTAGCDVMLEDHSDVRVRSEDPYFTKEDDDRNWEDEQAPPENPRGIFLDSYHESKHHLLEHGSDHGPSLINRMVFAQQVSALEAFLSDTLLGHLTSKTEAMLKLAMELPALKNKEFKLHQIAGDPELIRKTVLGHVRHVIYHRLKVVDELYRITFGTGCLDSLNDEQKSRMFEAIKYRHGCVHRNGRGDDDQPLTALNKQYVNATMELMADLVNSIDQMVRDNDTIVRPSRRWRPTHERD